MFLYANKKLVFQKRNIYYNPKKPDKIVKVCFLLKIGF